LLPLSPSGFPKNGHKEKGGAAETSQREVRDKHRPTEIVNIGFFLWFFSVVVFPTLHPSPFSFIPLSNDVFLCKLNSVHYLSLLSLVIYIDPIYFSVSSVNIE